MLDSIIGGLGKLGDWITGSNNAEKNNNTQMQIAAQNIANQKEFAQNGIRWKVADAEAAGLHPLAALGAQTSSFSPISVGLESPKSDFGGMGQDIGRAIDAGSTGSERTSRMQGAVAKVATSLSLEKASLENDLLRTSIAKQRAQLGPPIPSPVPMPQSGPDRTVGGLAVKEDDLKQKPEDHPQTKIVRPFGYPLQANPWFNDGQQFEDRYGDSEIGSTLKFGVNTLADHIYTGYGLLPEQSGIPWRKPRRTTHNRDYIRNTGRR